jgi:ubiquinone biosynthesis accessory factor UbiJ
MSVLARAINHALSHEPWARARLSAFNGSTFAVISGPVRSTCAIMADGTVAASAEDAKLTLTLSPMHVPTLLAQPARWSEFVVADGDPSLAATIAELALTLPWLVERGLASLLGPIVGMRVADAGRAMLSAPAYAGERLGQSVARYVRDEASLVVTKSDAHDFADAVWDVDRRIDALGVRLERLDRKAALT